MTTIDGGDQIAAVLALLLIPLSLADTRTWHWAKGQTRPDIPFSYTGVFVLVSAFIFRVQVAFIYLNACLSKLSVPEWLDGTAVYYWMRDPMFGPAGALRDLTDNLLIHGPVVAAATWAALVLEFCLGIAIVLPRRARLLLLPAGILFHLAIAITMGLWSFAFTMWAGLIVYLWPDGNLPKYAHRLSRHISRVLSVFVRPRQASLLEMRQGRMTRIPPGAQPTPQRVSALTRHPLQEAAAAGMSRHDLEQLIERIS